MNQTVTDSSILRELAVIVGPEYILSSPEDRFAYMSELSHGDLQADDLPVAVLFPNSAEEIAAILKVANREQIPVVPRGGGTGAQFPGGTTSMSGALVLVLNRMDSLLELDPKNRIAVVQPGLLTAQLQSAAEKAGLFYPPDPASTASSTMGGNVSECASGPRCFKYGITRDYVLGLEVVLPTGDIIVTGARTIRCLAGHDMTRLFVGAQGSLGIITKIIVRLVPLPQARKTFVAVFPTLEGASEAISALAASDAMPSALQLLDHTYIKYFEEHAHAGIPLDAEAILLLEVDGEHETIPKHVAKVMEICLNNGATELRIAQNSQETAELWRAHRWAFGEVARKKSTTISENISVPRSRISEMVRRTRHIGERSSVNIAVMGAGNLHATFLCDERDKDEMQRVEHALLELIDAAQEMGGSCIGEHWIKLQSDKLAERSAALTGMERIKKALDPNGVLNPAGLFG